MNILLLITTIALWGVVHSWLASNLFKNFTHQIFGDGVTRFYRLGYNIFAVLSFLPILYLMLTLPNRPLYFVPAPWSYLMFAGQVLSALLLMIALLQTDTLSFIGLRQLFESKEGPSRLITKGLYHYIRHPLYTFGLLFIWLSPSVSLNSFIVYVALTAYILIGAYFEERKLLKEFGQAYAEYRQATPMLIPWLRF